LIVPALVGAVGTALTAYAQSPVPLTIAITLAAVGILAAIPVFWALPTAFLTGTAAAGGIALIAAIGNLGGFAGPAFTGVMEDSTGGFETPLTVLAVLLVVGAGLAGWAREAWVQVGEAELAVAGE
jgi:MFS transporter, ACS family, tartrate transporter